MKTKCAMIRLFVVGLLLAGASPSTALTLSMGSAVGAPGTTVDIPIQVDDPEAVAGVAFTVEYDTAALELLGVAEAPLLDYWFLGAAVPGKGSPFSGLRGPSTGAVPTLVVFRFRIRTNTEAGTTVSGDYGVGLSATVVEQPAAGYGSPTSLPMVLGVNAAADPFASPATAFPERVSIVQPGTISVDRDGDGLTDVQEEALGLNPDDPDTDADGLPDGWEQEKGLNPAGAADAFEDPDLDGASNLREYLGGTDPRDANETPEGRLADADSDGDTDGADLAGLAREAGSAGCGETVMCRFDLDQDGDVDRVDLSLLLEEYGLP